MAALKQIICTECDGCGWGIDKFDLSTTWEERMAKAINTGIIDRNHYSKAGYRRDLTKSCEMCKGVGFITVGCL
jgi:hypothetical protein